MRFDDYLFMKGVKEMMERMIDYLGPIQMYVGILRNYFSNEELDEFDAWYLKFYEKFEAFIFNELNNPTSEINRLMKEYGELLVEYENSTLNLCLEAIKDSYQHRHMYLEGKRDVYLRYLNEVCHVDGKELLENMSSEAFEQFEKEIFQKKKPTF